LSCPPEKLGVGRGNGSFGKVPFFLDFVRPASGPDVLRDGWRFLFFPSSWNTAFDRSPGKPLLFVPHSFSPRMAPPLINQEVREFYSPFSFPSLWRSRPRFPPLLWLFSHSFFAQHARPPSIQKTQSARFSTTAPRFYFSYSLFVFLRLHVFDLAASARLGFFPMVKSFPVCGDLIWFFPPLLQVAWVSFPPCNDLVLEPAVKTPPVLDQFPCVSRSLKKNLRARYFFLR